MIKSTLDSTRNVLNSPRSGDLNYYSMLAGYQDTMIALYLNLSYLAISLAKGILAGLFDQSKMQLSNQSAF